MHYKEVKGILSNKNGMNIYRGCSHGCIYCDSRSKCYSYDHDFEDIEVKSNAIDLLEESLRKKRKKAMIVTGSMCDPYIHLESNLRMTRKSLEVIEKYGFGVAPLTKSSRILEDMEIYKRINDKSRVVIQMTLTTFDEELCKKIEPNVSTTKERVEALKAFRDVGIPTVVWLGPILPYINDSEENLRGILNYCIEAKVKAIVCFGMGMTLREGNREYYYEKLDELFPGLKQKYQKRFGNNYNIGVDNYKNLMKIYRETCSSYGIIYQIDQAFNFIGRFEEKKSLDQLSLF